MPEVRNALLAALLLASLPLHAGNSLQGLEMDVMDAGESAAHATARIALPRPDGAPEGDEELGNLDPAELFGREHDAGRGEHFRRARLGLADVAAFEHFARPPLPCFLHQAGTEVRPTGYSSNSRSRSP